MVIAVCAALDFLKADRDRGSLFQCCEKVLEAVNVPGQLVHGYIRQLPPLGLGHIKDGYHLVGGYLDFLFLGNGLPVLPDNRLPGLRVGFLYFLLYRKRRRGYDFDSFFAFHHVPSKVIFPRGKACHKGSVGLLHGDKQRIVKAVIVEFRHDAQIFFVTLAFKQFRYPLLQTVGNLFELVGGFFRRKDNGDNRARLLRLLLWLRGGLPCGGSVHFHLFRVWAFRFLRGRRYPVFLRYVPPVIPPCKCVLVVVDIALLGKPSPVIDSRVPPVFLIHEIFFGFLRQLRFFQFINKVMPVFFLIVDGRVNPVTVKVLCKVDKFLHTGSVVVKGDSCRKFLPVVVKLHF